MTENNKEILTDILKTRAQISRPLAHYIQALEKAYEHHPEDKNYADLRHGVADLLANTFTGIPGFFAPDSHVLRSLGKDFLLDALVGRLAAPLELIAASPIPQEDKDPLSDALKQAIEKVQSLKEPVNGYRAGLS